MNSLANILFATTAMLISACGTPVAISDYYDTDTASLQRFARMGVIEASDTDNGGLQKLGTVAGIYCKGGLARTYREKRVEATDQLMLKAAQRGATHISEPACTASGLDMANNCPNKVVCKAQALQVH